MTEAAAEVPPPGHVAQPAGTHRTVGLTMAIGGALLFSINGSVSKIVLSSGIDSVSLVLLRSAGAAFVLFWLVVATDSSRLRLTRSERPMLVLYGTVGIAMVQ